MFWAYKTPGPRPKARASMKKGWPAATVDRPGFHRGAGYWATASKAGGPGGHALKPTGRGRRGAPFRGGSWPDRALGAPRPHDGPRARAIASHPLRPGHPLVDASNDLDREAPAAERVDHQPASHVGGVGLHMAHGTQGHQLVQIEVGPTLGVLDDMGDLEGAPAAAGLAPPARPNGQKIVKPKGAVRGDLRALREHGPGVRQSRT